MRGINANQVFRNALRSFRNRNALVFGVLVFCLYVAPLRAAEISLQHTPLYKPEPHDSTIRIQANDFARNIARIQVRVTNGQMTDCSAGGQRPSSTIPCREKAKTQTHECQIAPPEPSASCSAKIGLGDNALVSYAATVVFEDGSKESSKTITYSGGKPAINMIARPIYWHTDLLTSSLKNKIDLALYPDDDYQGDYALFAADVSRIVAGALFNNQQEFSKNWTANRQHFNLWAGPEGADASDKCQTINLDKVKTVQMHMNGNVILHKDDWGTDCSTLGLGESSSSATVHHKGYNQRGSPDGDWVLVHEGAHLLFGLADEYDNVTSSNSRSTPKNLFTSLSACEQAALQLGLSKSTCKELSQTNGIWRIDEGKKETMREADDDSDFFNSSRAATLHRFQACENGACY